MSSQSDGEGFLSRWSRRKIEGETPIEPAANSVDAIGIDGGTQAPDRASERDAASASSDMAVAEGEAEDNRFDDVDFEALDYQSDYTRFMAADVPETVRNQALQKLWVSDPILANIDGLTDYSDDFTDAALAVPLGMLKTAHKVGRGFLSDEDVAKWESLGKTPADDAGSDVALAGTAATPAIVTLESPVQDEIRELFAQSDTYTHNLYPAESNHMVSPENLVAAGAIFAVARVAGSVNGTDSATGRRGAVGCGALTIPGDGTGELKRMWVAPEARGQRIGALILSTLIAEGRARELTHIRLETGVQQPEAIGLYERAGFERRGPYGGYANDPNSIFMELKLDAPAFEDVEDTLDDG